MFIRRMLQVAVVALCIVAASAQASSASSEITDMWSNPDEPGWGVNVTLQSSVAFLTFFVYDKSGNPVWYTAAANLSPATASWNGDLVATTGPWFGAPYTPYNARKAGTVTFAPSEIDKATLTYTVDGVTVTKAVQRLTWANENFTGDYLGGYSIKNTNCTGPLQNGVEEAGGVVSVVHNGSAIAITAATGASTCTYTGTYAQAGKLGEVAGNYNCSNGIQGAFAMIELTPTVGGFTGRVLGQNQYCQFTGQFGGVRRSH
jgi:hypothetical protein